VLGGTFHSVAHRFVRLHVSALGLSSGFGVLDASAGSKESIDEERRLLYVAMTRARRELHLYVPVRRAAEGIDDLPPAQGPASKVLSGLPSSRPPSQSAPRR
jgi:superfamily I DNA/RNA helicase